MDTLTCIVAVLNYLPYIHNNANNEHDKTVIAFSLYGESGIAVCNVSNRCVVMFELVLTQRTKVSLRNIIGSGAKYTKLLTPT